MSAIQSDKIEYTYRGRTVTVRPPYHGGDEWTALVDGNEESGHANYSQAMLAAETLIDNIEDKR